MKAGTCFSGHPRPEDRDGGRAHPVHGRTARDRGRQRACDPVADHPDGLLLRPSRYCVDCRGFVAVTAAFCTVQMAMQRRAIDLLSIVCVRDLTGGHPFHQAIELRPDIIDCCFLEVVRSRPVHNRTGLHVVVDRGPPNRQRHTDDESEDKSHCP